MWCQTEDEEERTAYAEAMAGDEGGPRSEQGKPKCHWEGGLYNGQRRSKTGLMKWTRPLGGGSRLDIHRFPYDIQVCIITC